MQVKKKDIENRILEAGRAEYMERGYRGGSVSRIAARAGVPIGNFYRYFDGKKSLLDAIVGQVYNFIPKFIADLASTTTVLAMPLEQFSAFIAKELYRVFWRSRAELCILLYKCQGTEYEHFRSMIDSLIYDIIVKRNFGDREITESERIMSRVVANGYLAGVLELLDMEWDEQKFTGLIQKITLFFFNDFKTRG